MRNARSRPDSGMTRVHVLVATLVLVSLLGTACGDGRSFAFPPATTAPTSPSVAAERVRPAFTAPPVTYSLGATADRSVLHYYNGSIDLRTDEVELSLGFRVQQDRRGKSELLADNVRQWEVDGVEPSRFQVDGGVGYWHESPEPREDWQGKPGLRRFYVLAKGAVTVTLSVYTPEGAELTDESRDVADAIVHGVRFDESGLTGTDGTGQAMPVVPFTFPRPARVTELGDAEPANVYWARYEFGGRAVDVHVSDRPDAAELYADQLAALRTTAAEVVDVTRDPSTASTIGGRVDEGAGLAPRHNGGIVLMYFILRKGDRYVRVRADGARRPLPETVRHAVISIVTGMEFT